MAVFLPGIDIFIGQIDTAGIADAAVYNRDLPVVAVVVDIGQNGSEPVGGDTVDALIFFPDRRDQTGLF